MSAFAHFKTIIKSNQSLQKPSEKYKHLAPIVQNTIKLIEVLKRQLWIQSEIKQGLAIENIFRKRANNYPFSRLY